MARFTSDIDRIGAFPHEPRVIGGLEALGNFIMTLLAFRRTDVFCARHIRQGHCLTIDRSAGDCREQQAQHAGGDCNLRPPLSRNMN